VPSGGQHETVGEVERDRVLVRLGVQDPVDGARRIPSAASDYRDAVSTVVLAGANDAPKNPLYVLCQYAGFRSVVSFELEVER
jgi:hypothetical protein